MTPKPTTTHQAPCAILRTRHGDRPPTYRCMDPHCRRATCRETLRVLRTAATGVHVDPQEKAGP